jgi:hypothetical protein
MAAAGETSIKDLVRKTVSDGQRLVKAQLALTQAEISATGAAVGRASVFAFIAFGAVLLFGIFILITIAYVFVAIGLPVWAGFGIVSLILLITAVTTGLLARGQARKIKAPNLSIGELGKTQATIANIEHPGL